MVTPRRGRSMNAEPVGARLHVLGCGRAARVIARWLHASGAVELGQICNRSLDSARRATEFMGAGVAVDSLGDVAPGDWLLVGVTDQHLAQAAARLAERLGIQTGLAFHLSGTLESGVLSPLSACCASVHPARAFADPAIALAAMPSTWLTAEGSPDALRQLRLVFARAGGHWLEIDSAGKSAYHAATVIASNFLVTLSDAARRLAADAGLQPEQAAALLADLQRGTLDNLDQASAAQALTGPIERADVAVCRRLLEAADATGRNYGALFRSLARATLTLARRARGPRADDRHMEAMFTSRAD